MRRPVNRKRLKANAAMAASITLTAATRRAIRHDVQSHVMNGDSGGLARMSR